ncbi:MULTISPECIES: 2-oxoglutarate dehydrogenase E1 component [Bacillus]|uniref:2-oxoglutarate dehydrogenase E1 component n=1 Tax=Bacillus TaxID=1386 RepID=UPI0002F6BC2B|nr:MULTISPECIES: 2-oxoglutarate dehydrogenase E1 component [Bacillus]
MASQRTGGNPWDSLTGPNFAYLLEKYEQYLEDSNSVDADVKELFDYWGGPELNSVLSPAENEQGSKNFGNSAVNMKKIMAAVKLVDNIRMYGHLSANIYPLNHEKKEAKLLDISNYDLTEADLRAIPASLLSEYAPDFVKDGYEVVLYLKELYTKTIAFEFQHVSDIREREWLTRLVESTEMFPRITKQKKLALLKSLSEVEGFEKFLHKTYVGQKRFSVEGLDALIPILDELISEAVQSGTTNINIGMAHRGRLNVLAHTLGKPYEVIFSEFQHSPNKDLVPSEGSIGINYGWTGDVKYHLGADKQIKNENIVKARLTLANNPSHLEFVGAIVEGYTRAYQDDRTKSGVPEQDFGKSLAVVIHGDAAFPGEGIVAETLNLSGLKGYQTGGSVHIITNNMIGFTTESSDSRTTKYSSDLAKGYEIPIVHVNADDPEACLAAVHLAYIYRKEFKKDFLIDLIGYRRFGHNEMDEPMTTNPMMYNLVHKHPTVKEIYANKLIEAGEISKESLDEIDNAVQAKLKAAHDKIADNKKDALFSMMLPETVENGIPKMDTSVSLDRLKSINSELLQWPEGFNVFKKLEKILTRRKNAVEENGKIEWALAESLAFGSILEDGTPIRMSGQDAQRGTFAHRHLVLHDSVNGEEYTPLNHISNSKASFTVINSPLTETAVLAFEYGYNVFSPETLVIWEAQFGDFANVAQVIFDQFISSSRAKWGQKSGLVMLLPHGYEGQGPEHSSARIERYLQLAAENNWTVANLSSAAQYFHILRRQAKVLKMEEVRPLVLITPKSLLRNPLVAASPEELVEGEFKPFFEDPSTIDAKAKDVTKIIISTGKMSIDLHEHSLSLEDKKNIKLVRLEEIYPFPFIDIQNFFSQYKSLKEIVWVQEEPKNQGAWNFVEPRLNAAAPKGVDVRYIGRRRRSSTAEGDPIIHKQDQNRIITEAFQ